MVCIASMVIFLLVLPYHPMLASIYQKLDDSNLLLLRQHVEPCIKLHCLQYFVVNMLIPLCFFTKKITNARKFNLVYSAWEPLDQMLLTWLQLRSSDLFLSEVLGSVYYYQVWDRVLNKFVSYYDNSR